MNIIPHRDFESRVESLVAQALGARATAVRVFRRRLQGAPDLAGHVPAGDRLEILLAAQVLHRRRLEHRTLSG